MSHLLKLIDDYKDRHGQPSDSSIARAIGISSQGLSAWRTRGIKEPPSPQTMRKLADLLRVDYQEVVLRAALLDAGWITEEPTKDDPAAEADVG